MNATVICHFYNEQYLLPWWLNHHKPIFKHGIMIDYASTDSSCRLIADICPHWTIVQSRNEHFQVAAIDREIEDIISDVSGPKLVLNATEFLYGDYQQLYDLGAPGQDATVAIPCGFVIESSFGKTYDHSRPLLEQCPWYGMNYQSRGGEYRQCRLAHAITVGYTVGRHYWPRTTDRLMIYWHGFAPWNEEAIARRLQIGPRVPDGDIHGNIGLIHRYDRVQLMQLWQEWLDQSQPMDEEIAHYMQLSTRSLGESQRP
jgi:hypothetical protein